MRLRVVAMWAGIVLGFMPACSEKDAPSNGIVPGKADGTGNGPRADCVNWTGPNRHAMVVAYHPEAADAGFQILQAGGNAFDAFVAAALADIVVSPGVTTFAGQLDAILYLASSCTPVYLDSHFQDLAHGTWMPGGPDDLAVAVPGTVRGLEAIAQKYGQIPFARLLEPAIRLASADPDGGFIVTPLYAATLESVRPMLTKSPYAADLFYPRGQTIAAGTLLHQPQLEGFLINLATGGAEYMYRGDWAARATALLGRTPGALSLADLAAYLPRFADPNHATYRGYDLYTGSGRNGGGLWDIAALKTLEPVNIGLMPPFSSYTGRGGRDDRLAADGLEVLVRIGRAIDADLLWAHPEQDLIDIPTEFRARLTDEYGQRTWAQAQSTLSPEAHVDTGSHTYQITVVDEAGNIIAGTHSIESTPFADGLFVEGVLLNAAGKNPAASLGYGRRISSLPMHLVFQGARPVLALGTFGGSLRQAGFQFLVNVLDYAMPIDQALSVPRFGLTRKGADGTLRTVLDPRLMTQGGAGHTLADVLGARSPSLALGPPDHDGPGSDTGYGTAIQVLPDGTLVGAAAPLAGDTPTVAGY